MLAGTNDLQGRDNRINALRTCGIMVMIVMVDIYHLASFVCKIRYLFCLENPFMSRFILSVIVIHCISLQGLRSRAAGRRPLRSRKEE